MGKLRDYKNKIYLKLKARLPRMLGSTLNGLGYISPEAAAHTTMYLYSRPLAGKILPYQRKFLSTADEAKVLYLQDIAIQTYHWKGTGPTMLLMHGWESNSWRWRKLLSYLRDGNYNVVAMDAPAHGKSGSHRFTAVLYAAMANEVVKEYSPDIIMGHSVGGMAALYFLTHYDRPSINKVVILASPNKWEDIANQFHAALGLNQGIINHFETAFSKVFDQPQEYYNAENFAAQLEIPGLLIHDVEDDINGVQEGSAIAARWKNVTYFETKGYGHSLQAPEVFEKIISYLKS